MNPAQELISQYGNALLQNPTTIVLILLVAIIIWLLIFTSRLSRRINLLMRGKSGASLEETMTTLTKELHAIHGWQKEATLSFQELDTRMSTSLRGASLIRFNPFKGTGSGGNQSFSSAFVNEVGEGIVISSLYSRDRISIFGKPLVKFNSTFELTNEEKQAVTEARKKLQE